MQNNETTEQSPTEQTTSMQINQINGLPFMDRMSASSRVLTADLMLLACALLWGVGFVAMKGGLDAYPTWWLLFLRFSGGTLLTGLFFHRRLARASRRDWFGGIVIGLFLFVGMGIQTLGLNYTTAGKQAFLTASYVIMVPLSLWVLHKKFPGHLTLFASFLCFIGMGLLASDFQGELNLGDILTVVSAFFFAMQIISIGHFAAQGDPITLAFVQFLVTGLLSGIMGLIFHGPLVWRGAHGLWEVFFTIVFSTFLCFSVQVCAQKYTPPTHTSLIMSLESVFGLFFSILLLNEVFTRKMAIGCALIFLAILCVELGPVWLLSRRAVPLPLSKES